MVGGRQADALGSTINTGTPAARGRAAVESAPTFAGGTIAPGVDGTLAAGSAPPNAAPVVIVRAGRLEDYPALVEIERKHFVIGTEIARGGMGRIVSARDRRLGRDVAIKELLVATPDLRARFEREARITANLQHPAIVNVLEAGRWPDGEPFYVMKFVSGQSLAAVIAERQTLDARMALLPNVIALVDALAFAHDRRVIHRDLKPANVLVGDYGETVVIDWGLAKELGKPDDAPRATPTATARNVSPELTSDGDVMGTPAYMPIEQANGDAVDERADVYALGAILYHLLAGRPPYEGRTGAAVLDAVIEGPPTPLAARVPGVPRELVTIVDKAMARDAPDRYRTAKGLAEDLKKFQTGQLVGAHEYTAWQLVRRWIRRHRAPLAVAAVAVGVLAVLAVLSVRRIMREQARTEQQRVLAVAGRGDAEDLVGFMLTDMRTKLDPLGKLDLLDSVATHALDYYAKRVDPLGPSEQARQALARANLADALIAEGAGDKGLAEYSAAIETAARLAQLDPARRADLAGFHERRGLVLGLRSKNEQAATEIAAAAAVREALAADAPGDPQRGLDLVRDYNTLADQYIPLGKYDEAHVALDKARAIERSLHEQSPTNTAVLHATAETLDVLGTALSYEGRADEAAAVFAQQTEIDNKLVMSNPKNMDYKRQAGVDQQRLASTLMRKQDIKGAREANAKNVAITESLVAKDPGNAAWLRDVWTAYIAAGDLAAPDDKAALAHYLAARDIAQKIATIDSTNIGSQRDLATSHEKVGPLLAAKGDTAGALAAYTAARAIEDEQVRLDPMNFDMMWLLAINHTSVADLHENKHELPAAIDDYTQARDFAAKVAAAQPKNVEAQQLLGGIEEYLGNALEKQGNHEAALAHYRSATDVVSRITAIEPTNFTFQIMLAADHGHIGELLLRAHDRSGAVTELTAALTAADAAAKLQADEPELKQLMPKLQKNLAKAGGRRR
ncbi:MAG TPA: protein kinase [Kofleriaceae bacterium]|jgi:tetratricopeptide (TPR) repeat protein